MKDRIIVTVNDYHRLIGLVESAAAKVKTPEAVKLMLSQLYGAKMLKQEDISSNVITMNSRIKLRDVVNKRETEITITYPENAEPKERRVSVFSEIGLALLGRRENDVVSWKIPGGVGLFEITEITYQPEAAGDYHL